MKVGQRLIPGRSATEMAAHRLDAVDRQLPGRGRRLLDPATQVDGSAPGASERHVRAKRRVGFEPQRAPHARRERRKRAGPGSAMPYQATRARPAEGNPPSPPVEARHGVRSPRPLPGAAQLGHRRPDRSRRGRRASGASRRHRSSAGQPGRGVRARRRWPPPASRAGPRAAGPPRSSASARRSSGRRQPGVDDRQELVQRADHRGAVGDLVGRVTSSSVDQHPVDADAAWLPRCRRRRGHRRG